MNKYLNSTTVKLGLAFAVGYYVGRNGVVITITKGGK